MEDFLLAGKISSEAREYAKKLIKPGVNIYEFANKVEDKIEKLGGKLAFPLNISFNEFAAHDTPDYKDTRTFNPSQVVKVDLGAHVNGFVGDTAFSVEIETNKYKDLISSSNKALNEAVKIIRAGVKIREIGAVISETIKSFGYNPISNLGGHGVGKYDLHSGLFIPNYDNGNNNTIKEGDTFAVEPFATTGKGYVINSSIEKIHALIKPMPVRFETSKKMIEYIKKNYNTLPFAERALYKDFSAAEVKIGLKELKSSQSIYSYPLLKESSNGLVSQAEHTIIVKDGKAVISTK